MIFFNNDKMRFWFVRIALVLAVFIVGLGIWNFADANHDLPSVCQSCFNEYITRDIPKKNIALTFDDGPDKSTPELVAALKRANVPATFFLIGQSVARYPNMVREISDAGFLIGNHSYTHGENIDASESSIAWELDSTNKLIEAVTGRSARLYRPPFLKEMDSTNSVRPLLLEQPIWGWIREHGYITVGRDIETLDWQVDTPEQVIANVKEALDRKESDPRGGNYHVMLLHSKKATIEAIPSIVSLLKARGYTIVPLNQLLGMTREEAMPASTQTVQNANFLTNFMGTYSILIELLLISILFITFFTLLRPLILLAIRRYVKEETGEEDRYPAVPWAGRSRFLSVSVLVPAYNESENIQATLLSLMRSTRIPSEILVLDDGSTDDTAQKAYQIAAQYPGIIRVIRLKNGGKSRALNAGIQAATGDIFIGIDGDTILDERAIEYLMTRFDDDRVGAVAGKVIPAQTKNIFEKLQYLEYLVGQNIDKEALSRFGAVNVVPGANGAWRRDLVRRIGGYTHDTVAEDQELTLAIHSLGYRVVYEPKALSYTEVPRTMRAFFTQRMRWMYGTFQCVWKFRKFLFRRKDARLGFITLPYAFIINVLFPVIVAGIHIGLLIGIFMSMMKLSIAFIVLFTLFDASYAFLAVTIEKNPRLSYLALIPLQRLIFVFLYTALTLVVTVKVLEGSPARWGKLLRSGTAQDRFFGEQQAAARVGIRTTNIYGA